MCRAHRKRQVSSESAGVAHRTPKGASRRTRRSRRNPWDVGLRSPNVRIRRLSVAAPDEVAGHAAIGGAWWRWHVRVLDPLAVLRIQRVAIPEHRLARQVVQLHELVEKRVLVWRKVG